VRGAAPLLRAATLKAGSLGAAVRAFKASATLRINALSKTPRAPVWQRGYHERIIRDEDHLARVREYIADNPRKWAEDPHNPRNWDGNGV